MTNPSSDADELESLRMAAEGARKRHEEAKKEAGIRDDLPARANFSAITGLTPEQLDRLKAKAQWQLEEDEKHQKEERARRFLALHDAARACLPRSFRWSAFEVPELAARLRRPAALEEAKRLTGTDRAVFVGSSGAGKTSLAAAALRDVVMRESRPRVRFESAYALSRARRRHPLGEGEPEAIVGCLECEILVLDDLGSDDAVAESAIKDVVFDRHWNALATWVTTWMTPEEVSGKYGDGIARRIFQGAIVIACE